ncbi:hypothetical protein [Bacteroides pyogenes]|uniref:hypothetical protein n=1 Tax=Bacteroides pyogenes TaxID=310300 RepID=UPI002FDAA414
MKHLNITKNLLALVFLGIMTACSSENVVIENVSVFDITTSDCKTSVSQDDTRPEYYTDFYNEKTKLRMYVGNDNTVTAQFLDVMDNCAIGQLHVDVSSYTNQIKIILYPDRDMLTDCVCMYDVDFKIKNLLPGNYHIEIYQTTSNKQTNSSNRIYQGAITLNTDKVTTLTISH